MRWGLPLHPHERSPYRECSGLPTVELVVILLRHCLGVHQTLIALSNHTLRTQCHHFRAAMYDAKPSQVIAATQSLAFYRKASSDCIAGHLLLKISASPKIAQASQPMLAGSAVSVSNQPYTYERCTHLHGAGRGTQQVGVKVDVGGLHHTALVQGASRGQVCHHGQHVCRQALPPSVSADVSLETTWACQLDS